MIISRLTTKAQTTIPQSVRTALGLRPGDALAYVIEEGRAVLTRYEERPVGDDPFAAFSEWSGAADTEAYGGCDVWDVVRVPFPYTNRPVEQYRPALIVALHRGADMPDLLWVLMITSAGNRRWAGDVDVSDLPLAGLPAPSVVRCAKIATIDRAGAARLGCLPAPDRAVVRGWIDSCLSGAFRSSQ